MQKVAIGRPGARANGATEAPVDARPPGTVRCLTCMDAGWLRRDVAVGHPDFGKPVKCPQCAGNAIRSQRDEAAVARALIERDIITANAVRVAHGQEPLDEDDDGATESARPNIAESVREVAAGMRRMKERVA